MRRVNKQFVALNLPSLRLEGGLFLPDQLERAALGQTQHQSEADYQVPAGLRIKDEYSRSFQIAEALWRKFEAQFERADLDHQAVTLKFVEELLRHAFAYQKFSLVSGITVHERRYPVTALLGSVVLVVAPHALGLEEPQEHFAVEGSGSRRKSAFQLAQECLNASEDHLWALVTNGRQIRLLRDAAALTRPSYLEIDLQDILAGRRYAEFEMAWRLLHASRAGDARPESAIWERWREIGSEEGTRVREGLREGVTDALMTLGSGFLVHPGNDTLRHALQDGSLTTDAYFQQLLRLVYRLIFLFNVEERGLLHPQDDSPAARRAREAYAEGYAMARLRSYCLKRRARNRHDDLWQAARIVFKGLAHGEQRLALPELGGLFAESQCAAIDAADLDNAHWLRVIAALRWSNRDGNLAPVDYRNMGPEELGSVYESLLELVPELGLAARSFGFVGQTSEGSTAGNARKLTGSYYTPDSLVQELIQSALEPVIEQRLADNPEQPTAALLDIKVIDPACGSGHFLLAAARRLAERLAQLRAVDGAIKEGDYRHALREVISHCIYGVDHNPMAIELARTALWLEGFDEGRPLGFLDHHLQCGDALLGVMDLKALELGIPKDAFKALSGDDKDVCKALAKANAEGLKQFERDRERHREMPLALEDTDDFAALKQIESMPEDSPEQIAAKEQAFQEYLQQARNNRLHHAADILVGTYLLPKVGTAAGLPTSKTLYLELRSDNHNEAHRQQRAAAQLACAEARVFHWPLAFPQVFARDGFDCVLGNPPWENVELKEEEFFASRHASIANEKNKAKRVELIKLLSEGELSSYVFPELDHSPSEKQAEKRLYNAFVKAKRTLDATSLFAHVDADDGGRYPLTGVGRVNTYALFSETMKQIISSSGRAGFVVPSGIATDDTTKAFFAEISQRGWLVSLLDIENREAVFPSVHRSYKFCLLTLGAAEQAEFVFFATQTDQLDDVRRRFSLTPEEFRLINPNTLTCPVFRSERDAELTKKLYRAASVLIDEGADANNWEIEIRRIFNMGTAEVIGSCIQEPAEGYVPMLEAKMFHQYDHRWSTYQNGTCRDSNVQEKSDPDFTVMPRYWIGYDVMNERTSVKGWSHGWLISWRDICRATDERTMIASILPRLGTDLTIRVNIGGSNKINPKLYACLLANLNSLVFDFVVRQKIGGTHLSDYIFKQLPAFSPSQYEHLSIDFITSRVLELAYTANDLRAWAEDIGYMEDPFTFDLDRRTQLRAELDAYYAKLYGLTRDELRYILDPTDVMGEDYPSETFRVLKNKEIREFGEYRTQRLVLEAWDKLEQGALH